MKQKLIISVMLAGFILAAVRAAPLRPTYTLEWDYPSSELSTNLLFKIYSSTNSSQPVATWPLFGTSPGTSTNFVVTSDSKQRFFVVSASNWWGESVFSNVAGTPPVPRDQVPLRLGP